MDIFIPTYACGEETPMIQRNQYQDWSLYMIQNHPTHFLLSQLGSLIAKFLSGTILSISQHQLLVP